jgi:SAM-dependent methyltransferase
MGCDPSAGMLSSNASFRTFEQPSLSKLPFEDGSVDLVTAVCVFHHVHGLDRALLTDEIRRVLSPRGLCCIFEHNQWNPVTRTVVRRCAVDVDAELLTARQTRSLLEKSGFSSLRTEYFLYLPERIYDRFGGVERMLSKLPFGGQYAVLAQLRDTRKRA